MNLRNMLEVNPIYSRASEELIEHVILLCEKKIPLAFYTLHNRVHFENVEDNLNLILFPDKGDCALPAFNEAEAFLLIAGAWLHDIGMLRDLLPEDNNLKDETIRHTHERRALRYVIEDWPLTIDLEPDLHKFQIGLGQLIFYHRKRNDITKCLPQIEFGRQDVRVRLLAALLRLADATELNHERTPDFLRRLYEEMGMNSAHLEHWTRYYLIDKVVFKPQAGEIVIRAVLPPNVGDFSFESVVNIMAGEVQEELQTVRAILAEYPRLAYRTVTNECRTLDTLQIPNVEELVLAFSPYIVMEQPSAGTMTERFADILLQATRAHHAPERLKQFAQELFEQVDKRRPGNVALLNLWRDLQNAWDQEVPAESWRENLKALVQRWLQARDESLNGIKQYAPELNIGKGHLLIILGFSSCVRALLQGLSNRADVHIYVAEIRGRSLLPWPIEPQAIEGIHMAQAARELGYDTRYVEPTWVPTFFQLNTEHPLHGDGKIMVLCGARGVRRDGSMLNTPGHLSIAIAAKHFGIPFYVATESNKLAHEPIEQPQTVKPAQAFSDIPYSQELREDNISIRQPFLDLIPADLITGYITQRHILQPSQITQLDQP